ncbi:hypothetical protein [Compostimonas suwonensis]|uniref:Uncharacterized protein n=1 Tax=Compostimonas suwonensis TaxID=1048394 RepID=A0A2M9BUQ9_9MICO|nr:hypothetical protein [Compostimonas suwonensis]PJJ61679.1 hypothetical protein CLV54_2629 [Compostimonas suwonensis]
MTSSSNPVDQAPAFVHAVDPADLELPPTRTVEVPTGSAER